MAENVVQVGDVQVPADLFHRVDPVFQAYGVPAAVWVAIAGQESGFKLNQVDDNNSSYGLFQLHFDVSGEGGQAPEEYRTHPEALFDPTLNARLAARAIADAYRIGKDNDLGGSELVAWTAANSGHPGYYPANDPHIEPFRAWGRKTYGEHIQTDRGTLSPREIASKYLPGVSPEPTPALQSPGLNSWKDVFTADFWKKASVLIMLFVLGLGLIYIGSRSLTEGGSN